MKLLVERLRDMVPYEILAEIAHLEAKGFALDYLKEALYADPVISKRLAELGGEKNE